MPRPYVYSEQNRAWDTSAPTTPRLPSGEVLVGNKSYESLMRFFTTFDISPKELKRKAWERLYYLHNKVWLKLLVWNCRCALISAKPFAGIAHSLELSVYVVFISLAQNPGYLIGKGILKIGIYQMSVNSNFRGFWLAHVTRNILGNSLFWDQSQDGVSMAWARSVTLA